MITQILAGAAVYFFGILSGMFLAAVLDANREDEDDEF